MYTLWEIYPCFYGHPSGGALKWLPSNFNALRPRPLYSPSKILIRLYLDRDDRFPQGLGLLNLLIKILMAKSNITSPLFHGFAFSKWPIVNFYWNVDVRICVLFALFFTFENKVQKRCSYKRLLDTVNMKVKVKKLWRVEVEKRMTNNR